MKLWLVQDIMYIRPNLKIGSVTLSWTDSFRPRTLGTNTNQGELFYDNSQTEMILERIKGTNGATVSSREASSKSI